MRHALAAGFVAATIIVAPVASAVADSGSGCSAAGSIAGCFGGRNGTIDITGAIHHRTPPKKPTHSAGTHQAAEVDAVDAYCADAQANASAATAGTAEIVPLCGFASVGLGAAPVPGRDEVASAFREVGLLRGVVWSDPRVRSLVNLETYFWCGDAGGRSCEAAGEGERTVTVLGQAVRIRPRIVSYGWDFGDGGSAVVGPGVRAAHTYRSAGDVSVRVTLTWTADYAVGGGAFQPIGDTTTTTSAVRVLPVRESQAVIVH
jgi:PKD domain